MENKNLRVSEMFYSIQGEGRNAGVPAVFLRMQSCNLLCDWCDTIEVWKRGKRHDISQLVDMWKHNGWIDKLLTRKVHLVITGGEPLLQQDSLEMFLKYLGESFIEVETNCTVLPKKEFDKYISQYNVSPKLVNSGMSKNKRYNSNVIKWFSDNEKSDFKFVIVNGEDVNEIINEFVNPYSISSSRIYLMPKSNTKEELEKRSPIVIDACKDYGFNYSPRLQLSIWDRKTGI